MKIAIWFKKLKWYYKILLIGLFIGLLQIIFSQIDKSKLCSKACIFTYYTMGGSGKVYIIIPHEYPEYCFHILDIEKTDEGKVGKAFLSKGQPTYNNLGIETKYDYIREAFDAGMKSRKYWVPLKNYYQIAESDLQDNSTGKKWDKYCSCEMIDGKDVKSDASVKEIDDKIQLNNEEKQINKERNLQYLFSANGGLIGFFDDGTVVGCSRCDFMEENIGQLYKLTPYAKFEAHKDFLIF